MVASPGKGRVSRPYLHTGNATKATAKAHVTSRRPSAPRGTPRAEEPAHSSPDPVARAIAVSPPSTQSAGALVDPAGADSFGEAACGFSVSWTIQGPRTASVELVTGSSGFTVSTSPKGATEGCVVPPSTERP